MNKASSGAPKSSLLQRISPGRRRVLFSYVILLAVYASCIAVNREFLSWNTLRLQLVQATFIGVIAIGETFAILIGQIDLSVPWTITLSAILATNFAVQFDSQWVAFAVVVGVGVGVGLLNTLGVFVLRVHSLIWTLSVNLLLQGVALIYTNAVAPTTRIPPVASFLALGNIGPLPTGFVLWACCAVLAIGALRLLPFGRCVYAIGTRPAAALLSGVRLGRIYVIVFVLSGLCSALVGLLLAGYSSQAYLGMGNDYLMPPVAAVVIGGTPLTGGVGGYVGSIAGALIVVLLQAMLITLNVSEGARQMVFGALLLALAFLFIRRSR
jgi:ribose transport system permease protein